MTTYVLPIIKITTPNGQICNVNAYHITMIDLRRDSKGYAYPTVCLSSGASIAVTEEEADRVTKLITKIDKPVQAIQHNINCRSYEL
jgi:uncharacterized protein YlzI (FlbEa/FlbD family)